jgi:dTDP-4-amino-4,6-dideoxygalactose transaminase
MATTPTQSRVRELPSDANITGRNFGPEELKNLAKVLESGTLNCTKGTWVNQFESDFAEHYGAKYVRCVTSGTAAVHAAVAAIDPEPGDEIITTGITDMGAITPIMYQAAIPVFADVDPYTYNVTAESIEKRITPRTKAIIVTHLFGNMCEMGPIMELARSRNIPVIEDAAQAFYAELEGKRAGLIGDFGCFSLQQGKHMTTGEGGIVVVNNEDYERRVRLFVDKAWGYGDPKPDHYFLALNYRMTELQGAVACGQLSKVDKVIASRVRNADLMTELISGVEGVHAPRVTPNSKHVYWKYCVRVDADEIEGGVDAFAAALKTRGIFSAPRYIQKPAFQCEVIRDQVTFGKSGFPFRGPHREGLPPVEYRIEEYPGTVEGLATICVLPWNEFYTEDDVRYIADAVIESARELRK